MNSILIAQNIIKRAFRSKREIVVMLLLPIMAISIMTFFTGTPSMQKVNVGIVSEDNGKYAELLTSVIKKNQDIKLITLDKDNFKNSIKSTKVSSVFYIPSNFSKDLDSGKEVKVDFYGPEGNMTIEKLKLDINQSILSLYSINTASNQIKKEVNKDKKTIVESLVSNMNKGSLSAKYTIGANKDEEKSEVQKRLLSSIGFSIMFIMILIFNSMGVIAEDKKRLTLARISTFRVKQWEMAIGNLLGGLVLGIIQLIPITIVIGYIYKLAIATEILGIFLVLLFFIISTIGLSIGLSGFMKNNLNPVLTIAIVIFPTSLIGGCLIPESMLPDILNKLGYIVPQKWTIAAIQKIIGGAGVQDILLNLGLMLMFGLVFALLGAKTLKPLD